ncbi:unnamed protein product [Amoebophrya sp. A25]|nr:unnamed protein product [Amoebophrya sp. A25]|eukprot:GSA25T00020815001.1
MYQLDLLDYTDDVGRVVFSRSVGAPSRPFALTSICRAFYAIAAKSNSNHAPEQDAATGSKQLPSSGQSRPEELETDDGILLFDEYKDLNSSFLLVLSLPRSLLLQKQMGCTRHGARQVRHALRCAITLLAGAGAGGEGARLGDARARLDVFLPTLTDRILNTGHFVDAGWLLGWPLQGRGSEQTLVEDADDEKKKTAIKVAGRGRNPEYPVMVSPLPVSDAQESLGTSLLGKVIALLQEKSGTESESFCISHAGQPIWMSDAFRDVLTTGGQDQEEDQEEDQNINLPLILALAERAREKGGVSPQAHQDVEIRLGKNKGCFRLVNIRVYDPTAGSTRTYPNRNGDEQQTTDHGAQNLYADDHMKLLDWRHKYNTLASYRQYVAAEEERVAEEKENFTLAKRMDVEQDVDGHDGRQGMENPDSSRGLPSQDRMQSDRSFVISILLDAAEVKALEKKATTPKCVPLVHAVRVELGKLLAGACNKPPETISSFSSGPFIQKLLRKCGVTACAIFLIREQGQGEKNNNIVCRSRFWDSPAYDNDSEQRASSRQDMLFWSRQWGTCYQEIRFHAEGEIAQITTKKEEEPLTTLNTASCSNKKQSMKANRRLRLSASASHANEDDIGGTSKDTASVGDPPDPFWVDDTPCIVGSFREMDGERCRIVQMESLENKTLREARVLKTETSKPRGTTRLHTVFVFYWDKVQQLWEALGEEEKRRYLHGGEGTGKATATVVDRITAERLREDFIRPCLSKIDDLFPSDI